MTTDGTIRDQLKKGMQVEINPQTDRTRKIRVQGKISEILTNSAQHSHGILVQLDTGMKGRVKKVITSIPSSKPSPIEHQKDTFQKSLNEYTASGEDHYIEFKSSALWSERLKKDDIANTKSIEIKLYGRNASKVIIAKTIAGFLNTDGGTLVIGIKENKNSKKDEVIGVESEFSKLVDQCKDGYRRMIVDSIIKPFFPSFIFNHISNYINIVFEEIDNKLVCGLHVSKSDNKVFLKLNKKDCFFIRVDASTRFLQGEEIVDYCMKRFT